jgi:ATP-dependent Clp protease protease subunit
LEGEGLCGVENGFTVLGQPCTRWHTDRRAVRVTRLVNGMEITEEGRGTYSVDCAVFKRMTRRNVPQGDYRLYMRRYTCLIPEIFLLYKIGGTMNILLDDEDEEREKKEAKSQEFDPLVSKLLKTRTILLSGEINKDLAEKTIRQLLLLENMGDDPIRIFIDSPGGDADAGYAIFDMIRFVKPDVWTVGMGLVASAAAIIQLASPKERRIGLPNSHYLIHQPLSGIQGVATDIEIHARELEKLRAKINRLIAGETGVAVEKVEKDTDRDFWMNAEEAIEYGLISRIITKRSEL